MKTERALGLDALRGFAILTMFLSGLIPFGVLPDWMYHAQVPPPQHVFNPNLPGITWVDLVFPFFLFSMGAAIPLALSRRLEQNLPAWKTLLGIFQRGFLLAFFAIYIQHLRPYTLNPDPTTITWLHSLFAFIVLFAIFFRFPASWNKNIKLGIRIIGWITAILLLYVVSYPESNKFGVGFSLYRSDIIILVLSNVVVSGSIIWWLTRNNLLLRLGLLGILIAIRLSHLEPGWIKFLWDNSPLPWLGNLYFQQYLFIIIPGTVAGDLLLSWLKKTSEQKSETYESKKFILPFLTMIAFILIALVGLKARWVVETTIVLAFLCLISIWLFAKPKTEIENLFRKLMSWGVYWLILGLFFEAFEGGIKKDRATVSYYFITSGLAICFLIGSMIIINIFKKEKWFKLLIDTGQNPMIAYAGITNLLPPLLGLTQLNELIKTLTPTPWLGALGGLFKTVLLGYIISFFTKNKIFWRT